MLTLIKLGLAIGMVLGLAWVAQRFGAKIAGLLAGYPLGTAISLYFIGHEISPEFAAASALYTQAGFSCALALVSAHAGAIYFCRRCGYSGMQEVAVAVLAGLSAYALTAWILQFLPPTLWATTGISLLCIGVCHYLMRTWPEAVAVGGRTTWVVIVLRGLAAAAMIIAITAAAHWLPASLAGLLAAFPVTLYPLLLIVHISYGGAQTLTLIKHYPSGLGALLIYTLSLTYTYPHWGLAWGTFAGFVLATCYLWGWHRWRYQA